jgi:ABC-2 type transport system ATP-binding protein
MGTLPDIAGPMIRTTDLRKTFKSRRSTVEAVRGVDLEVGRGVIFGFLGPNGAGKTTTLRMLATLIKPTSGEAWVAGVDLASDPAEVRRRIGYVPQGGSTDPAETGRGELVLQARLHGHSAR